MELNNTYRATLVAVILAFSYVNTKAQETTKSIKWMSWKEAISAREQFIKENQAAIDSRQVLPKKIFIDVYTDWCGWCKRMDATTFADPNVVDYMNANYYAVKLDAEMKDTVIYNGHTFVNQNPTAPRGTHTLAGSLLDYKLSYPSYVIMDENVNRSMIFQGYKTGEELIGILVFFKTNQYLLYKAHLEATQGQ